MNNFVSYENATAIMNGIATKFNSLSSAYVIKGNSTFENLPVTLTSDMSGFVYNITNDFTTDSRFVEGAGKDYSAGTNIVVADLSTYSVAPYEPGSSVNPSQDHAYVLVNGKYVPTTDTTVVEGTTYYHKAEHILFDVISTFVDVDGIEGEIKDVADSIADEFDASQAYEIGDVVIKDGVLYEFTSAHTADDPWSSSEVKTTTIEEKISDSGAQSLTPTQVNTLIGLLD